MKNFLTALTIAAFIVLPARAHNIYTGVYGKNGQLCCGGNDCAVTVYREAGSSFEFLTREKKWVAIPVERITFLPVPGDVDDGTPNRAHLCYRAAKESDRLGASASNVFDDIYFYCAFIAPEGY